MTISLTYLKEWCMVDTMVRQLFNMSSMAWSPAIPLFTALCNTWPKHGILVTFNNFTAAFILAPLSVVNDVISSRQISYSRKMVRIMAAMFSDVWDSGRYIVLRQYVLSWNLGSRKCTVSDTYGSVVMEVHPSVVQLMPEACCSSAITFAFIKL